MPILRRASLSQLESIITANHPSSLPDYDDLWRPFVFKDFTDMRKSSLTSPPQEGWRSFYHKRQRDRLENLAKAKRHLERSRMEAEMERQRKKVMVLDAPVLDARRG
ncbi:hypothetical protein HDU67_003655, partial [Dinochytrium kinnereticum]